MRRRRRGVREPRCRPCGRGGNNKRNRIHLSPRQTAPRPTMSHSACIRYNTYSARPCAPSTSVATVPSDRRLAAVQIAESTASKDRAHRCHTPRYDSIVKIAEAKDYLLTELSVRRLSTTQLKSAPHSGMRVMRDRTGLRSRCPSHIQDAGRTAGAQASRSDAHESDGAINF